MMIVNSIYRNIAFTNKQVKIVIRIQTTMLSNDICTISPFSPLRKMLLIKKRSAPLEDQKERILYALKRVRDFTPNTPSPIGRVGSILLCGHTLRNFQYQGCPNLDAYGFNITGSPTPFAEEEKKRSERMDEEDHTIHRVGQNEMPLSGFGKKDTQRKDHRDAYKHSLEEDLLDRKSNRRSRSKSTKREKRKADRRGYEYIPPEEEKGKGKKGKERELRPAPRPRIDRSDVSTLYDFDEGILSSMGVTSKNDRKCLGEVARCVFRMKNDSHDHVETRISGVDPSDKVLVFSLIYKGSVPLDFSEQEAVKKACGPRFKNIRCVTVPFENEAERRQFQMSCITQIVVDMVKKKYVTQVHHHHHHHH
jgi:hypothetical protein